VPAFDCLGDPVRRRILGPVIDGERVAGEIGGVAQDEFGLSQSRVPRSTGGPLPAPDGRSIAP
jgi:hypothetical protein